MPDINGIPYVESGDLVSAYPTVSQDLAQEVSDQLALKQADVMTTKGDLATYGTGVARLGVGSNGQVLTADSGETLGVKWADAAGGLTLIDTATASADASVSINDCFSAAYTNYKIIITGLTSVVDNVQMRLRASATDDSTANAYVYQTFRASSTSLAGTRSTSNLWRVCQFGNSLTNGAIVEVFRPFVADETGFTCTSLSTEDGARSQLYAGSHNQTTSYDGFTIFPSSGTITATIHIYGYGI